MSQYSASISRSRTTGFYCAIVGVKVQIQPPTFKLIDFLSAEIVVSDDPGTKKSVRNTPSSVPLLIEKYESKLGSPSVSKLIKADFEGPRDFRHVLVIAGQDYALADFPQEDHRGEVKCVQRADFARERLVLIPTALADVK